MSTAVSFEEVHTEDVGFFDECQEWRGKNGAMLRLAGWARDASADKPGHSVVIADEARNTLAEAQVSGFRLDVAQNRHAPSLTQCGWSVFLPKSRLGPGSHLLSAFSVDPQTGVARRLAGSFRVEVDEGPPPDTAPARLEPRPATKLENDRLNREEQSLGRTILSSYPTLVLLELTARCNLNCLMCCRYNTTLDGHISDELYEQVVSTLYPLANIAILSCRAGEPALYPGFERAIEDVHAHGLQGVINTNATMLKPEHIHKLVDAGFNVRFSIDGATARTYHTVRGASLSTVAKQVQQLVGYARETGNRKVRTGVTFTPMTLNIRELPEMVDLIASWGVEALYVQKFGVHNAYTNKNWAPETDLESMKSAHEEALRRAVHHNVSLEIGGASLYDRAVPPEELPVDAPPPLPHPVSTIGCNRPFSDAIVYLDGAVVPCCFGAPPMGYLQHQSFEEIWNGAAWAELRRGLIDGDPPDYCRHCDLWKPVGRQPQPAAAANPLQVLPSTPPPPPDVADRFDRLEQRFRDLQAALEQNTAALAGLVNLSRQVDPAPRSAVPSRDGGA